MIPLLPIWSPVLVPTRLLDVETVLLPSSVCPLEPLTQVTAPAPAVLPLAQDGLATT